jgi:hypothetical protein
MVSFTGDWMFWLSFFVCWTAENGEIDDEGVIQIAKGLEKNTSLKILRLRGVFRPHYSSFTVAYPFTPFSRESLLFDVKYELCDSHICD